MRMSNGLFVLLGPGRQPRSIEGLLHRRRANECDSALALLRAHASEAIRSKFKQDRTGNGFPKKPFRHHQAVLMSDPLGF